MAKKEAIFKAVNDLIKLLDDSIKEREELQRALCNAYEVTDYEKIEPYNIWSIGFNLETQLEDLRELREDLQNKIKYIGAFKDVI